MLLAGTNKTSSFFIVTASIFVALIVLNVYSLQAQTNNKQLLEAQKSTRIQADTISTPPVFINKQFDDSYIQNGFIYDTLTADGRPAGVDIYAISRDNFYDLQLIDLTGKEQFYAWSIQARDVFRNASVKLNIVNQTGRRIDTIVNYVAPRIRINPTNYHFETIVGDRPYTDFTIYNDSEFRKEMIDTVKFKFGDRGFYFDFNVNEDGYIKGFPKFIDPHDSLRVRVVYKGNEPGYFSDSIGVGARGSIFAYRSRVTANVKSAVIRGLDVDFDNVTIGDEEFIQAEIQNTSDVDLIIHAYIPPSGGAFRTNLAIDSMNTFRIPAGRSGYYNVYFTPDTIKEYLDSIVFNSNAVVGDSVVYLRGRGVAPGLIVKSYNWGRKRIDRPGFENDGPYSIISGGLRLKNTLNEGDIEVYGVEVEDSLYNAEAFSFVLGDFENIVIPPGETWWNAISVEFNPKKVGYHKAVLKIKNSLGSDVSVVLEGIGVVPKLTKIDAEFDATLLNDYLSPSIKHVKIVNRDWEFGDITQIDSLIVDPEGGLVGMFSNESNTWFGSEGFKVIWSSRNIPFPEKPLLLYPGDTLDMEVKFVAQHIGEAKAAITTLSDAWEETTAYLTGNGIFYGLKAWADSVVTCVDDVGVIKAIIQNYGHEDIPIDSIRLSGSEFFSFDNLSDRNSSILLAGQKYTVHIRYSPEVVNVDTASLFIFYHIEDFVKRAEVILSGQARQTTRGVTISNKAGWYKNVLELDDEFTAKIVIEPGNQIDIYQIKDIDIQVSFDNNFLVVDGTERFNRGELTSSFEFVRPPYISDENGEVGVSFTRLGKAILEGNGPVLDVTFRIVTPKFADSIYQANINPVITTPGNHCIKFENQNSLNITLNRNFIQNLEWRDFIGEKNEMLNVYPNPVEGDKAYVGFEIKEYGEYEIFLSNSLGQRVRDVVKADLLPGHYVATLPLDAFYSGDFWCIMVSNNFIVSKKFILNR